MTKHNSETHGHSKGGKVSLTYSSWVSMINRCENVNASQYSYYGALGINICDRWRSSFENFLADMGERPSIEITLDRFPNVKGNYEPGNCRWADKKQQARLRKNSSLVEYNGEIMCISELSEKLNIPEYIFRYNIKTKRLSIGEIIDNYNSGKYIKNGFKPSAESNKKRVESRIKNKELKNLKLK